MQDKQTKSNAFYQLTLREISFKFIHIWNQIFQELIDLPTQETYSGEEWWMDPMDRIYQVSQILLKEERLIYVGLMMVIISFFTFFIFVTS